MAYYAPNVRTIPGLRLCVRASLSAHVYVRVCVFVCSPVAMTFTPGCGGVLGLHCGVVLVSKDLPCRGMEQLSSLTQGRRVYLAGYTRPPTHTHTHAAASGDGGGWLA